MLHHWAELVAGKTRIFEFAVPAERKFFTFRICRTGSGTFHGKPAIHFTMELANGLLRFLVDPIELTYGLESRRLYRFEGISNINDDQGRSYRARIDFEYLSIPDLDSKPVTVGR